VPARVRYVPAMSGSRAHFDAMCALIEGGETVVAIERYYAEDVTVFENRVLARAGRARCMEYERAELAKQPRPPDIKILRRAFDETSQTGFLEYRIRFAGRNGRPMRLEEVSVQQWSRGKVDIERYYYEGMIDEGD